MKPNITEVFVELKNNEPNILNRCCNLGGRLSANKPHIFRLI